MSDRELLEWAAQAFGDPKLFKNTTSSPWQYWIGFCEELHCDITREWNPLTDDGDAFRLAVKLGMGVNFSQYDAFTNVYPEGFNQRANTFSERTSDPAKLAEISRRAIVRAAAEIGRSLP